MTTTKRENRTQRILIISIWESLWSLGAGAGVSDDHHFIRKAHERGFEVHMVAPGARTGTFPGGGYQIHSYPDFFRATRWLPTVLKRVLWPLLFQVIALPAAVAAARRIRPDFILGHSHYTPLATWTAGRLTGVPFGVKLFGVMELVHMEWSTMRYLYKNFEQIMALKIPQDAWFILNDGTRGREAAIRLGVPPDRIHFLPNGIDVEWAERSIDREAVRAQFGLPPGRPVVLFLARLVASKRPFDLLRSVPRATGGDGPRPLFLFVGDGPLRAACETYVRDHDLQDDVRFQGAVPHESVPEIMSACDLFVTISNLTNMAIPTCEAFLCGLPVVAYDVGDTAQVVKHNQRGLLVPDGDINRLADAIMALAGDGERRARLGANAKEFARREFTSWDERTAREFDLIESLLRK